MRIILTSVGRPRIDSANGVELEIYRIAETLGSLNHEVLVACVTALPPISIPAVCVRTFRPHPVPFGMPKGMKNAILSFAPEVVVMSSVYTPFNSRVASWLRSVGIPYVIRPAGGYGTFNEKVHRWKKVPYRALLELPMLNRAAFVWAIGDAEDVRRYRTTAPIVTTPKGFDLPRLEAGNRAEIEALEGLDNTFLFGFVGRIDPVHKGLDLALRGFRQIDDARTAFALVGPVNSAVKAQLLATVASSGAADRVRFLGPLFGQERDRFLAAIDAFVHTSRWEGGIPYAVIEAAVMEKPLLITQQADPSDLLYQSRGCVRVQLDSGSIAQGMRRLMGLSSAERSEMGNRAAKAIKTGSGWNRMVEAFIQGLRDHRVIRQG